MGVADRKLDSGRRGGVGPTGLGIKGRGPATNRKGRRRKAESEGRARLRASRKNKARGNGANRGCVGEKDAVCCFCIRAPLFLHEPPTAITIDSGSVSRRLSPEVLSRMALIPCFSSSNRRLLLGFGIVVSLRLTARAWTLVCRRFVTLPGRIHGRRPFST